MKNRFLYLLFGFSIILVAACKETPDDYNPNLGYDYYPLEVGKFFEYQMDSIIFDPNGDTTVFHTTSFLREEILDTLTDNEGNTMYKIEQYERAADTLPWNIKKVLSVALVDNQATRTEDNLHFVKIAFPLAKGNRWKGNSHFDEGLIVDIAGETVAMFKGWEYRVNDFGVADTIGGFQFDETILIEEAENENLIELRRSYATYAKGVGLVARELWILDTQCIDDCVGQPWEQKAEKGFILRQTIINHN